MIHNWWAVLCIVAWFYTTVCSGSEYVYVPFDRIGARNGTAYERTQVCAQLELGAEPHVSSQRPRCWPIPVQHHVLTLSAATSTQCRGTPVGGSSAVEWYGRLRMQAADELVPWVELAHSGGGVCTLHMWYVSSEIVVKCDGKLLILWEAPAVYTWLWTRVEIVGSQLCIDMRYDRDGRVTLNQCVDIHVANGTRLEQVTFVGTNAVGDVLSWNGQPILQSMDLVTQKHWQDAAACSQAIWNTKNLAKRQTRYIDNQWVINPGEKGRVEMRLLTRDFVPVLLETVGQTVVCGLATDCSVHWMDQLGETLLVARFAGLV